MAANGSGPMRIELRRDNPGQSWGFRLQGGIDFPTALSIQSVNPGSLAERFGLTAGDAVLQINNKPSDQLEHEQAKQEIMASGNNVMLIIQRGAVKIWKPKVTPMSELRPNQLNQVGGDYDNEPYIQKTSLAADKPEVQHIGSAHNRSARPFQGFGGGSQAAAPGGGTVPAIVNAQYNTPINLYSTENTVDAFKTQSNILTSNLQGLNIDESNCQSQPSASLLAPSTDHTHSSAANQGGHTSVSLAPRSSSPGVFRRASPIRLPASRLPDNDEAIENQKSAVIKELKKAEDGTDGKSFQSNIGGTGGSKQSRSFQMLQAELNELDAQETSEGGGADMDRPAGMRSVKAPVFDPNQHEVKQAQLMTCKICGSLCVGVFVRIKGDPIHPECFKCCKCGVNLKNQGYFHIEGKMYCEIHAKQVSRPGYGMDAQVVYR